MLFICVRILQERYVLSAATAVTTIYLDILSGVIICL